MTILFRRFNETLTHVLHDGALLLILLIALWAGTNEALTILEAGHPRLHDILTLFIYLEVFSMLLVMLKTHHVPVRFLIYIMITAMARWVVIDIKELSMQQILGVASAIFILAISVLIIKYASAKFPSEEI